MKDKFPVPTLVLIRGLPGSGKSTIGALLAPEHNYAADDFFTDEHGNYKFNQEQIHIAHRVCATNVINAMIEHAPVIAVANTFTRRWEASNYFVAAKKHGYTVFIIECQNDFGNVHNAPADTIEKMKSRWQPSIRKDDD